MNERDTIRAAAFGSFKARQVVFGEQMEGYYQLLMHVIEDIDKQLSSSTFNNPELTKAENFNRRTRAARLRSKLCSLRDQLQNVKAGLKTQDDYSNIEHILADTPLLVNTILSKIVPLPGALRFQPRNAIYLLDDLTILIDALKGKDELLAESFNDIVAWMEDDVKRWRTETGKGEYVPEDILTDD